MKISNFLYSFVSVIFLCLISSIARSEDTLDDLSQSMESIAKEFDWEKMANYYDEQFELLI